jgi:DNA-binding response OmpR family regulator
LPHQATATAGRRSAKQRKGAPSRSSRRPPTSDCDAYIDERTVDVHVGRLRKALNRGCATDPIRTVRGAGYALNDRFVKTA